MSDEMRDIDFTVRVPVSGEIEDMTDREIAQTVVGQNVRFVVDGWGVGGVCIESEVFKK